MSEESAKADESPRTKRVKTEAELESKMFPRCIVPRPTALPDLAGKRLIKLMCSFVVDDDTRVELTTIKAGT